LEPKLDLEFLLSHGADFELLIRVQSWSSVVGGLLRKVLPGLLRGRKSELLDKTLFEPWISDVDENRQLVHKPGVLGHGRYASLAHFQVITTVEQSHLFKMNFKDKIGIQHVCVLCGRD